MTASNDPYIGHVEPHGAPAVRELSDLRITKLSVGPMDNNAYLVVCRSTDDAVLIDAAADAARILEMVGPDVRVGAVITTHSHGDHWQALAEVKERTGAKVLAGTDDADGLPVPVDVRLEHGDAVQIGTCALQVIALRGHTPGSVALLYEDPQGSPHLFTGDSLFPGGPGRTVTPEKFSSLMNDLEDRVFGMLPDDTQVYPGHGDDTTLGAERPHLAEWRDRGW